MVTQSAYGGPPLRKNYTSSHQQQEQIAGYGAAPATADAGLRKDDMDGIITFAVRPTLDPRQNTSESARSITPRALLATSKIGTF